MPTDYSIQTQQSNQPHRSAKDLDGPTRQQIGVSALARSESITTLAQTHNTSRKFIYQQKSKVSDALDDAFAPIHDDDDVLFHLPVTKDWLQQVVLSLTLTCHSSYGGVTEFFRDILDRRISKGGVFNIVQGALGKAQNINKVEDLSPIAVGAHDEIFQGDTPVLVGCDVESTYVYLLSQEEHRDSDTWAIRLLELSDQGIQLDHVIADGGKGLRSGQSEAWPETPCWGDVFHPLYDMGKLVTYLENRASSAEQELNILERKMLRAKKKAQGAQYSRALGRAREKHLIATQLLDDIKTLSHWLRDDILSLNGPDYQSRLDLLSFVVEELTTREAYASHRIRPVRRLLEKQGEDLMRFAEELDLSLVQLACAYDVDIHWVRKLLELQAIPESDLRHWELTTELYKSLGAYFYDIQKDLQSILQTTVRASSLVENLNSRLRNYFFLRKTLGNGYLGLLQFYLNHRRYMRSSKEERVGKSPKELLTGQAHKHWLEILGYRMFRQNQVAVGRQKAA